MSKCPKLDMMKPERIEELYGKGATAENLKLEEVIQAHKRTKLKAARLASDVTLQAKNLKVLSEGDSAVSGLQALLARDFTETHKVVSLDNLMAAEVGLTQAPMSKSGMNEFFNPTVAQKLASAKSGGRVFNAHQKNVLEDMIHILNGEKAPHGTVEAPKFVEGYRASQELAIKNYEKVGGDTSFASTSYVKQAHNAKAVSKAGYAKWREFINTKLDTQNMFDNLRAREATMDDFEEAMENAYNNIIKPPKSSKGQNVGDLFARRKFIQFKDAKSFMEYQTLFGNDNYAADMMNSIEEIASKTATIKVFGHEPAEMFKQLVAKAERSLTGKLNLTDSAVAKSETVDRVSGNKVQRAIKKSQMSINNAKNMFSQLVERSSTEQLHATTASNMVADALGATTDLRVASKLGNAPYMAMTDMAAMNNAARNLGLPQVRMIKKHIGNMLEAGGKMGDGGDVRKDIADLGLGMEYALDRTKVSFDVHSQAGTARTRAIADAAVTMSGLAPMTSVARATFQFELNLGVSRMVDGLSNERLASVLDIYGFSSKEIKAIKNSPRKDVRGHMILDPANMDSDLAAKYVGMIEGETSLAVPVPDARVKAALTQGTNAKSASGAIMRSVAQFHSFNATMLMNNLTRMSAGKAAEGGRLTSGLMYMTTATTIAMGMMQAKEIMHNKTPRDFDMSLVGDAITLSGTLPYLSDLINAGLQDQRNKSFGDFVGGAAGDIVNSGLAISQGNVDTEKAVTSVIKELPFLNHWAIDQAVKSIVDKQVTKRLNHDKWLRRQRANNKRMTERGQTNILK